MKFAIDVTQHLALASCGQSMSISVKCQSLPNRPVCEIRYQGPQLTVPIPRYITGIFNAEMILLRRGKNPGSRRPQEAEMKITAYQEGPLETIEICSASGMEAQNLKKLPLQTRLMGAPDVKGLILRIDPRNSSLDGNPHDPRKVPSAVLKSFHVGFGIPGFGGKFPTDRCNFEGS